MLLLLGGAAGVVAGQLSGRDLSETGVEQRLNAECTRIGRIEQVVEVVTVGPAEKQSTR